MTEWTFLNDEFIKEQNARLHFTDLSFLRGYGIFDFFRVESNRPLFLTDHLCRFYASAQAMHLPVFLSKEELTTAIFGLIERNDLPEAGIRISLTGGYATDGFSIGKPNLILSQHRLSSPSDELRAKGIGLLSYCYQRQLPHVKTIDYLMAIWLQPTVKEQAADDILYYHNGLIAECPRSNFFLVTADDRIVTPAENVLHGITRKKVIDLAKDFYAVEERAVGFGEIKEAKEAFITSTIKQVLPVRRIDNIILPERKIGRHLQELFLQACKTQSHATAQTEKVDE